MKIKTKLSLIFVVTLLAMASVYMFIVVPKLMLDEILNISSSLTSQVHQLDKVMGSYRGLMRENLQGIVHSYKMTEDNVLSDDLKMHELFNQILTANRQIKSIALVKHDGSCTVVKGEGQDGVEFSGNVKEAAWYALALESPGQIVFSDIAQQKDGKPLQAVGAVAIKDFKENNMKVIGFSMDIDLLQEFMRGMVFNNVGIYGIHMGDNALIVEDRKAPFVGHIPNLEEQIDSIDFKEGEVVSDITYNGKIYHMTAMKSEETPWTYFFMVDDMGAKALVLDKLTPILAITGLTSIFMLIVVLVLFHFLVNKPLTRFSNITAQIADTGDMNLCLSTKSRDEIGSMARSFNTMMNELKNHRNNLNEMVAERTRELGKMMVAIEQSPSMIIILDEDGNLEYANRKAVEGLGYGTLEEMKGLTEYAFVSREVNEPEVLEAMDAALSEGRSWEGDVIGEDRNGTLTWIHLLVSPVFNEKGCTVNYIAISNDISQQKETEHALIEAKSEAEAAARAKSDFLANMSHEIRTPMNAIIGLNALLSETELTRRQKDYVDKIGKSAGNLLGVINDILDFSKIEAGKLSTEKVEFSLDDVIENISNVIGMKAFENELEFVIDRDPSIPEWLLGDPLRLGQVLLNLTNNAVKFTKQGEILLKISRVENGIVRFDVTDTGIGMSEEQIEKVFSAFSQADTSTTRKFGGTGLGLAISRNLVELMGGELEVESSEHEGSRFWFTLELPVSAEKADQVMLIPSDVKGINIMVIDDNEAALEVYRSCLAEFKNMPVCHTGGKDALKAIAHAIENDRTLLPDLILLDFKMSELDGVSTWLKIKEAMDGAGIAELPEIILITAYGRDDVIKEAHEAGIAHILMKPVLKPQLVSSILQLFSPESIEAFDKRRLAGALHESFGPDESIRGAKILLVEDNEINQQVAMEMLQNWGFEVFLADNGKMALDLVMHDPKAFDVVLMDLHMPIMDGYEAASAIRSTVAPEALPIIALSADVLEGVDARVMASGMQGHVGKPIDPQKLFASMASLVHLSNDRIEAERMKSDMRKNEKAEEAQKKERLVKQLDLLRVQLPSLDVEDGAMRLSWNVDEYVKLLMRFRDGNKETITRFMSELTSGKVEEARRTIHTIKGVSGNLGAKRLESMSIVLEQLVIDSDEQLLHVLDSEVYSRFEQTYRQTMAEIETLQDGAIMNAFAKKVDLSEVLDDAGFQDSLVAILELLREYDTEAEERLSGLSSAFGERGLSVEYRLLMGRIESYEFDAAMEIVDRILNSKG